MRAAATVLSAAVPAAVLVATEARAQTLLWSGDDGGYARQIALAVSDTHVFLPEAYSLWRGGRRADHVLASRPPRLLRSAMIGGWRGGA